MSEWLGPLRAALDQSPVPVRFFVRDDDAGWDDRGLLALLDVFDRGAVPIDLAVIPRALHAPLARELLRRAASSRLGLHQHGFRHANHEPTGRKCEFGPSRSAGRQRRDIVAGRERLHALLGVAPEPFFTPPWNRCTEETATCLAALGFAALSRDASAAPLGSRPALADLPVHVDWFAKRHGFRLTPPELGAALAEAVLAGPVVGVMLHHAVMDEGEREGVAALLAAVTRHPQAHWTSMADTLPSAASLERETA